MSSSTTSLHLHAHGSDEASEQLAPFLHVRYVQLERGPVCFQGTVVNFGSATVGQYHGSRNKLERFDVPRGRILALLPNRGLARVGVTDLDSWQVVFVRGPHELVLFTDRECHALFALLPDAEPAMASGTRILQLSQAQALGFVESIETLSSDASESSLGSASVPHVCLSWLQGEGAPMHSQSQAVARRNAAVRAREYIDRNLDRRLSLASMCHASYSSPRALEYGFREVFGVSPIAYVRCSRLSRVRRELYSAPRIHGIVTQLAMKWGFWHLSQFSRDYCELFGELPSATLNRANVPTRERIGLRKSDSRTQALPAF